MLLVQSTKKVVGGVNNTTLAYGSNVTLGNLLCNTHVHWQTTPAAITVPSDTLGHSYQSMTAELASASGSVRLRSFWVANASAGADTVNFDVNGTNTGDLTVVIAEFSDMATAFPLDQSATGAGTSTAAVSAATPTTAQADELLWGAMTHTGTSNFTIDETVGGTNGYSLVQENEGGAANMPIAVEYKTVSAVGTYTSSWTISVSIEFICHVTAFKAAGPVSPVPAFQLSEVLPAVQQRMM